MADPDTCFLVTYRDIEHDEIRCVQARTVCDSDLGLGFVCIGDFVLEPTGRLVDPRQDAVRRSLENVRRLHLNLYAIVSIAEVGDANAGLALDKDRTNVVVLRPPEGTRDP